MLTSTKEICRKQGMMVRTSQSLEFGQFCKVFCNRLAVESRRPFFLQLQSRKNSLSCRPLHVFYFMLNKKNVSIKNIQNGKDSSFTFQNLISQCCV